MRYQRLALSRAFPHVSSMAAKSSSIKRDMPTKTWACHPFRCFRAGQPLARYAVALFALLVLAMPAWSKPRVEPLTVTLSVGWRNNCRPGGWTPVQVFVSSAMDDPFVGYLEISNAQDDQHRLVIQQPIVVPAQKSVEVPLATKFSYAGSRCLVTVRDRSGRTAFSHDFELYDYRANRPGVSFLDPRDVLLAVAGRSGLEVPDLNRFMKYRERQLVVSRPLARDLPAAWTGYCGLDALILHDPDWSQLNQAQVRAIAEWVSNGGRLMVTLGTSPIPRDTPLGELIPFELGAPRAVEFPSGLLQSWSVNIDKPVRLPVWQFPPGELPAGWQVLEEDERGGVLSVRGEVGFGQIVLYGYDPVQLPLKSAKQLEQFWVSQLKQVLGPSQFGEQDKGRGRPSRTPRGMRGPWGRWSGGWTAEEAGVYYVLSFLLGIKELEPISVWWVLAILGTLAVLIGPVDYLVLKRLKRLPWTYVSFITILAVFTIGAYYGVQIIRAGRTQVRRITVIDKIAGTDCCWQSGYTGIFASRSGDYPLEGVRARSWWSGITPASRYYGRSGKRVQSMIGCVQGDGNIPVRLPVNIWSMRTLLDEGPPESGFPLAAKISREGETVTARITNNGLAAITSGTVRVGTRSIPFRRIEPGETITVKGRPIPSGGRWFTRSRDSFSQREYSHPMEYWVVQRAEGTERRTEGIERRVQEGAAVIYAAIEDAPLDVKLKGKKASGKHIVLLRLVI